MISNYFYYTTIFRDGRRSFKRLQALKQKKNYLNMRYAALNCTSMIHGTPPTGVGNNIGVSKQLVSKYLLDPLSSSVSKPIKNKLNNEFIALRSDVKNYL